MNLYLATIEVDVGCRFDYYDCVVYAESEKEAIIKAEDFFNERLKGEDYATVKKIRKHTITPEGIVYQNCFKEISGTDKEEETFYE